MKEGLKIICVGRGLYRNTSTQSAVSNTPAANPIGPCLALELFQPSPLHLGSVHLWRSGGSTINSRQTISDELLGQIGMVALNKCEITW